MFREIRPLFATAFALIAYFAVVQPGAADTTSPFWTCRASVGYFGPPSDRSMRIEPFVANGSDASGVCVNDDAGHTTPPPLNSDQGSIVFRSVYAGTRIDPT